MRSIECERALEGRRRRVAAPADGLQRLPEDKVVNRLAFHGARGAGERVVTHTERVGTMLDGTIAVIEGKSFGPDGKVPFNAFAVVSFDARTRSYAMQSYTGGRSGSFPMTVTERGYAWEIPAGPNAKVRYKAVFDGTTWTETGDFAADGQPPRPFFKMTLTRIGDSDWPGAGGVARD